MQQTTTPTPGQALKAFRHAQKLSRKQIAEAFGVERMTVWRWEADVRKIEDAKLPKVVEFTGIPASTLRPDLARLLATNEAAE